MQGGDRIFEIMKLCIWKGESPVRSGPLTFRDSWNGQRNCKFTRRFDFYRNFWTMGDSTVKMVLEFYYFRWVKGKRIF